MSEKKSKKEVKPADKKVGDILERHPDVENSARGLFRNENGRTIVQERAPRGDLPQDDVIMPRNEFDLTAEDLEKVAAKARGMIDPLIAKYDEETAMEDALSRAIWSVDGSKYQGRMSANTQALVLDLMHKGGKSKSKEASMYSEALGKTKSQLADEFKAKGLFKEYDSALPQGWIDDLASKAGKGSYDKILSSFVWAYDKGSMSGFPFPLTSEAADMLKRHMPTYYDYMPESAKSGMPGLTGSEPTKEAASIDSLLDAIPTSTADIKKTRTEQPPRKEDGMKKEMLQKMAEDLSKKLDAIKVLLCDGEDEAKVEEDVSDKDAGSKKGPGIPDGTGPGRNSPECPMNKGDGEAEGKEAEQDPVVASLDEIAELVEREAHEKQDIDLFRIAFQIDSVSDFLSGTKDASALQTDPDDKFIREAFKAGVKQRDSDEKFMDEFKNDNTEESRRVVGKVSVMEKKASELPYAVKRDA